VKKHLNKIASVLTFIIGLMAIFAGGKVLLGQDPGYYVINWLPLYNYTAGILTFFITGALIWLNHKAAFPIAIGTFAIHGLVMVILQTGYRDVVAPDSIRAMTVRLIVWAVILGLLIIQSPKKTASN